jgi:hypothetical protein
MTSRHCQYPDHQGDRLVGHGDLFEARLEFRRLTDQGRQAVKKYGNVCRGCMNRWVAQWQYRIVDWDQEAFGL